MNEITRVYNVVVNTSNVFNGEDVDTKINNVSEKFFNLIEKYAIEHEETFGIDVCNRYREGALNIVTKTITIRRSTFVAFTDELADAHE